MNEHPFQALLELVQFDQAINHINSQIAECKQDIANLENKLFEAENTLGDAKKKVRDLQKLVDEQELIMKEVNVLERGKKNLLGATQNYKEMMALQAEILVLQEQEANAEQQLMDCWNKLEAAQKELAQADQAYTKNKEEIDAITAKRTQEIAQLQSELEAKQAERKPLEVKVPDEWREKYTIMKARVANPIVPVKNSSCSACYYTITDQEMMRLKRRALLQCHGCFRLLFSEEAMATFAEPSADKL